jgi:hypothetical protein
MRNNCRAVSWIISVLIVTILTVGRSFADPGWQEHRTRHFFIYYKKAPTDFIKSIEKEAEGYYEEITRNLGFTRYHGWTYDDRAKIYIYDDQEDYVNSGKQAGWSHGVANAQTKTIRTFPSAHGFFDSILPHELGHIIFREFIGFVTPLPLWLDEGVAMYQEKAKRWGADADVKKALAGGTFISLEELTRMSLYADTDKATIELYYAEAASIVAFLIRELGEYRFVRFCKNLQDGEPFLEAICKAFNRFENLKQLNDHWVRYLQQT